jgi:hypothetical protein
MHTNNYDENETTTLIIFIIIFIISLTIIYIGLYFIFIRKDKSSQGEYCDKSSDCMGNLVCSGGNQCVNTPIEDLGEFGSPCISNASCQLGYLCIDGMCGNPLSSTSFDLLSSFNDNSDSEVTNNRYPPVSGSKNRNQDILIDVDQNISRMDVFASMLPPSNTIHKYRKIKKVRQNENIKYIENMKLNSNPISTMISYHGNIEKYYICINNINKHLYLSSDVNNNNIVNFYHHSNNTMSAYHSNMLYHIVVTSNNKLMLSDKHQSNIYRMNVKGGYMILNNRNKYLSVSKSDLNTNNHLEIQLNKHNPLIFSS